MRWEDERYVRVYTRDTVEWEMLCWQARALMPLILRKVDRAGLLELGKHGARGLAASVKIPVDVVTAGLNGDSDQLGLIESGAVEIRGEMLVVPNFIAAQETPSSDAQRKRDQREKDAALARMSQNVTESHDSSRGVTNGHSVPSDLCRTVPTVSPTEKAPSGAGLQLKIQEVTKSKPDNPKSAPFELVKYHGDLWVKTFSPADGKPPHMPDEAFAHARNLLKRYCLDECKAFVDLFVADRDPYVVKRGHRFVDLSSRIDGYRRVQLQAREYTNHAAPRPPVAETKEVKL